MKDLTLIIPPEVQFKIREFYEQCRNGQIVLNFEQGCVQCYEFRDHRRLPKAIPNQKVAVANGGR